MGKYYTYAYLREDGTPYYIGKGLKNRASKKHFRRNGKVFSPPSKDKILILKNNLTEKEAFKHEKYMIFVLGRKDLGTGILRNLTCGGEGASGYNHSDEFKSKIKKIQSGRIVSQSTREKMRNANLGKILSDEHKEKIGESQRGKVVSEEIRKKISDTLKGKKHSDERIKNIRKGMGCGIYTFISPDGKVYKVDNMTKFCYDRNLTQSSMSQLWNEKLKTHKGWKKFNGFAY